MKGFALLSRTAAGGTGTRGVGERKTFRLLQGALQEKARRGACPQVSHMRNVGTRSCIVEGTHVVRSPFEDIPPMAENFMEIFEKTARRVPELVATECGLTGRQYRYGELLDSTKRVARFLQEKCDVQVGEPVGILIPNSPEYPIPFIATMSIGAAVCPINTAFTPGEVLRQLRDSGAKVLVVDPLLEEVAQAALGDLGRPLTVLVTGPSRHGHVNLIEVMRDPNTGFAKHTEILPEMIAGLCYSSGTTGVPKGALVSHRAVQNNMAMSFHEDILPSAPATESHQESVLGLLPFFHAYGMYAVMMCNLALGSKLVTLPKFLPEPFVANIVRHKVEVLHLVTPLIQFVAQHPLVRPQDLDSVRVAMCTAAPVHPSAALALKRKAPRDIVFQEGYGMTETMPTNFTPLVGERIGSCGTLMPNVRAIVRDITTGEDLPQDTPGELCVKTPSVMSGYHGNPEASAAMWDDEGWFRTGDVARYDSDGYFYIVDRIKELIKVKGMQVSPTELEEELLQHPGVSDVGVVGVPDERAGEVPRAYVVPRSPELTENDLQVFLADRVAKHKQLAGGVRFVDQLPKNQSGKLLRRELQQKARLE
ncbi:uncharacterized protein LOC143039986 [Oratosquilla oratoria]|uniref:uncharacterized protein LOC143039986 n=1 Tax=Oratosquilla oratoria TaxID=337810 RepID=UPI003F76E1B0